MNETPEHERETTPEPPSVTAPEPPTVTFVAWGEPVSVEWRILDDRGREHSTGTTPWSDGGFAFPDDLPASCTVEWRYIWPRQASAWVGAALTFAGPPPEDPDDDPPVNPEERMAIKHTPEIEAYLAALDHLDSAHDLLQNVNAQIIDQVHAIREQAKVEAGFLVAQEARRVKNGRKDPT